MTTEPPLASPQPPAWKPFVWPAIIVALLAGHVIIVGGALVLSAALIPAATVAPAGYAEALAWDDEQALRRASEQLGWTLIVTPSDAIDPAGKRDVAFTIRDANGAPVAGAELLVTLYHHSRPGEALRVSVPAAIDEPGVYVARLRMRREGFWRLSASARRGQDEMVIESDFWLSQPGANP